MCNLAAVVRLHSWGHSLLVVSRSCPVGCKLAPRNLQLGLCNLSILEKRSVDCCWVCMHSWGWNTCHPHWHVGRREALERQGEEEEEGEGHDVVSC